MRRDMSRKDQPQEKGKSGRTELRRSTPVLLSSEEMSASRQGGEDPDAQQPHEQPHEAAEVELVDDDDKEVQADFQAQERAAKEKQDRLKKGLGPKGNLRADYWRYLKPVLERRGPEKPLQCLLKCTRGGEGVCGKLLSSENPAKAAKDHFTYKYEMNWLSGLYSSRAIQ